MSPAYNLASQKNIIYGDDQDHENDDNFDEGAEIMYQKGVQNLCQSGIITRVPRKYILPVSDRPTTTTKSIIMDHHPSSRDHHDHAPEICSRRREESSTLDLPIIDFSELRGTNRCQVIQSLQKACQEFGFFQLVNHGISENDISDIVNVSSKFFDLPFEERAKYMSSDMYSPVRYGTSVNQTKDQIFCWRDFLKLSCTPLVLSSWPSSPRNFRQTAANYSKQTRFVYLILIEAILESLGLIEGDDDDDEGFMKEFEEGSQMMVMNCYPRCPEPELTLGMAPHSDYGLLTLLLQDEVEGLQIQYQENWVTVKPIPNSFVVNVGDHLEILSNGRYKSVLHRVLVNSLRDRISVASFHSFPFNTIVRPSPKLVNEANPRLYKDTDFAAFLQYISSREPKTKNFLQSRKLM